MECEIQVDDEGGAGGEEAGDREDGEALRKQVLDHEAGGVVVSLGEGSDEDGVAAGGLDSEGEVLDSWLCIRRGG